MDRRSCIFVACGLIVSTAMVIFLSKSSFSETQFSLHEASSGSDILVALFALFVLVLLISPHLGALLMAVYHSHIFLQVLIQFIFFAVFCAVGFVLKNQKLGIHSTPRKSCIEKDEKPTRKNPFNLYSVGSFAVLGLFVSWERNEKVELGFFSILLQLTMEISVEITVGTDHDKRSIWFTLVTALFPFAMIFARRCNVSIVNDTVLNVAKLFPAVAGVVLLYVCSFTDEQFEDRELAKGMFFIIFGILLVLIIPHTPFCLDALVRASQEHFLVKALVGSLLLLFVSALMFLNKYPGFRTTQTNYSTVPSCVGEEGNLGSDGNLYDLLSAGAFSVYTLIISSQKRQPMELGVFGFSLELTMYACIEISDKNPGLWFLCTFAFCVGTILIRSYLGSLIETDENSSGQQGVQELVNIQVITNNNEVAHGPAASIAAGPSRWRARRGGEYVEMESVVIEENTANGDGEEK